ncbi:MAG: hypothetical protein AAGD32_08485 [Planctomycetota bacterium]
MVWSAVVKATGAAEGAARAAARSISSSVSLAGLAAAIAKSVADAAADVASAAASVNSADIADKAVAEAHSIFNVHPVVIIPGELPPDVTATATAAPTYAAANDFEFLKSKV